MTSSWRPEECVALQALLGLLTSKRTNKLLDSLKDMPNLGPDPEARAAGDEEVDREAIQKEKRALLMQLFHNTGVAKVRLVLGSVTSSLLVPFSLLQDMDEPL
jgi:hypothetical protein